MFVAVMVALSYMLNRSHHEALLQKAQRITTAGTPGLAALVAESVARLQTGPVQVFVAPGAPNAYTFGLTSPRVVVLRSALLEIMDRDELSFVLGHELGHVRLGHTRLNSLVGGMAGIPSPFVASALLSVAFLWWNRACEYSADRAGLLVCGKVSKAISALVKLEGGVGADLERTLQQIEAEDDDCRRKPACGSEHSSDDGAAHRGSAELWRLRPVSSPAPADGPERGKRQTGSPSDIGRRALLTPVSRGPGAAVSSTRPLGCRDFSWRRPSGESSRLCRDTCPASAWASRRVIQRESFSDTSPDRQRGHGPRRSARALPHMPLGQGLAAHNDAATLHERNRVDLSGRLARYRDHLTALQRAVGPANGLATERTLLLVDRRTEGPPLLPSGGYSGTGPFTVDDASGRKSDEIRHRRNDRCMGLGCSPSPTSGTGRTSRRSDCARRAREFTGGDATGERARLRHGRTGRSRGSRRRTGALSRHRRRQLVRGLRRGGESRGSVKS